MTDLARLRELARGWLADTFDDLGEVENMSYYTDDDVDSLAALLATATDEACVATREACAKVCENGRVIEFAKRMSRGPEDAALVQARDTISALSLATISPRAAALARVVEGAKALVDGMPYTMGEPGEGQHNALRVAVDALDAVRENEAATGNTHLRVEHVAGQSDAAPVALPKRDGRLGRDGEPKPQLARHLKAIVASLRIATSNYQMDGRDITRIAADAIEQLALDALDAVGPAEGER